MNWYKLLVIVAAKDYSNILDVLCYIKYVGKLNLVAISL